MGVFSFTPFLPEKRERNMDCKCKYYTMEDGVRVCVQCGKPANSGKIEDKVIKVGVGNGAVQVKGISVPAEVRRIKRVVKKGKTKRNKR